MKKNKTTMKKNKGFILDENSVFSVQEAYKIIRTNLIFSLPDKGCKKILITSTVMHEYKSTTSVNLAITLAENGYSVLLLDCDMRMSNVANTLKLNTNPGLSECLVGLAEPKDVIQPYRDHLDVITCGTIPPNPSELLGTDNMKDLISEFEKQYDYIILDSPPLGPVTDSVILARLCNGYVMVVRKDVARKDDIDKALTTMEYAGAKMLGFIFTDAVQERGGYYYRYKK